MNFVPNDDPGHSFSTIWEHVECGISIIDAATREIVAINPVAARMFGDDASKIIGKRCHQFICPAEDNSCPIMDKGQVVDRSERKFVKANGESIPIIKSVAKIQYNGRLALLESFTDISNLKKAEEQLLHLHVAEQANQAKSDFLSRMSHEMRTPMNAIIGMTKIAENTDDISKLRYCLSMIGISSEHLLGLINDILDMSKIEAGKFELDHTSLNIESILSKLCNLIIDKTEEKSISLSVFLDKDMPTQFVGDELRLLQVIANLVSNAVKFTPENGAITLTVGEAKKHPAVSVVRFVVTDTGIGMTQEQIAKLFNAFEQADTSISRRFGGTGLGLVISKSIVERMNGTIDVQSSQGAGSIFTVEVELERPEQLPRHIPASLSGARVLVVDSDAHNRNQFLFLSSLAAVSVEEADSVRAALACIQSADREGKPYVAIFARHDLPDGTAIELARQLETQTDKKSIAVMAPFPRWNKIDVEAMNAGLKHFLSTPLFASAIIKTLCEVSGNAETNTQGPPDALAATPDLSHVTLLLAEDVEINREIFTSLLENTGVIIETAENGAVAIAKYQAAPTRYDLIIMDVQMPDVDGYEATKTIRSLPTSTAKTIPIIAMTANAFKSDIEKCLASGMNDHLAKPIDEKIVIGKIQDYCPRKK